MNSRSDSQQQEIPPQPEPHAETPPPAPGGTDAVVHPTGPEGTQRPAARDVDPRDNPATTGALPENVEEGEDTSTRATQRDSADTDTEEPPA